MDSQASNIPKHCTLLTLPPELRNKIYRLVLINNESISINRLIQTYSHTPHPTGPGQLPSFVIHRQEARMPSLLQTCRRIRSEAIAMFFHRNIFTCPPIKGCNAHHLFSYDRAMPIGHGPIDVYMTTRVYNYSQSKEEADESADELVKWIQAYVEDTRSRVRIPHSFCGFSSTHSKAVESIKALFSQAKEWYILGEDMERIKQSIKNKILVQDVLRVHGKVRMEVTQFRPAQKLRKKQAWEKMSLRNF